MNTRCRVAASTFLVFLVLAMPYPQSSLGKSAGPGAEPSIGVTSQPFATSPNELVVMRLAISTAGLSDITDTSLAISLGPAAESRAAVAAVADGSDTPRYRFITAIPLPTLERVGEGEYQIEFRPVFGSLASTGNAGGSSERTIGLPGDGVYPLHFELRRLSDSRTPAFAATTTWLAFVTRRADEPLRIGFSVCVGTLAPGRDGFGSPTPEFFDEIAPGGRLARTASLAASSTLPVTLQIVPETISDLIVVADSTAIEASKREDAVRVLGDLVAASRRTRNETVATPYARPPSSVYVDHDFDGDLEKQVVMGTKITSEMLGVSPTSEVALAPPGPLNGDVIERLVDFSAVRIVLGEERLKPTSQGRSGASPTQPFLLAGSKAPITAMAADKGLSELLEGRGAVSPSAAANRALAEIAATYYESPGNARSLVVSSSIGWDPTTALSGHLMADLAALPIVQVNTIGKIFDGVPLATGARRAPVLRETQGEEPQPVPAGTSFTAARESLAGYESILVEDNVLPSQLQERIFAAQGAGPLSGGGEGAHKILDAVAARIDDELSAIRIPASSGVTLTSRDGVVPVRIDNETGYPVRVALWLNSEHVSFPDHANGEAFVLMPPGETRDVRVVAGATGAFTINARLASPDGELRIADSRLPVRSTGASSASLLIAIGAAGFLFMWWARELRKSFRARRGEV